ncbi:hypothetical protein PR202_ga14272 [Eleusine coracana subsp. coracana]|uniref:ADP/ATP translocase n=1 Tax=Eleusine coracana subsp. coracana TaxID=191504 RepID=A0AAV5CH26_ELECO|nr:hypothetical protein PR202_ga14272 [Eleusine coracana subsp. coracana]
MAAAPEPDNRENGGRRSPASVAADFAMGGAAAVVAKTGAAPVERVKLLLQNQGELLRRGHLTRPYKGIANAFTRVLREEGVAALWRGNQANVIRYFPTQAGASSDMLSSYVVLGYFKSFFGYDRDKDGKWKSLAGNLASGSAAGATTSLLLYHLDYARTRLATDAIESRVHKRQFSGLLDVYKKTLTTDGIPGLYRGFSVSIVGITLYRGLYFGIYDTVKPLVLVGPLEIVCTEGFLALFRGVGANILSGMAGAGVLSGYDQLQRSVVPILTAHMAIASIICSQLGVSSPMNYECVESIAV